MSHLQLLNYKLKTSDHSFRIITFVRFSFNLHGIAMDLSGSQFYCAPRGQPSWIGTLKSTCADARIFHQKYPTLCADFPQKGQLQYVHTLLCDIPSRSRPRLWGTLIRLHQNLKTRQHPVKPVLPVGSAVTQEWASKKVHGVPSGFYSSLGSFVPDWNLH